MGFQGRRDRITIAITSNSQQGNLPLSLGELDQLVVTSDQTSHTFDLSIINEHSDTVWGPRNLVTPENGIRPALLPIGILTIKIENPVPPSGTVTIVAIPRER